MSQENQSASMNRSNRVSVARDTVDVVERGSYEVAGQRIDIAAQVQTCLTKTQLFPAAELHSLRDRVLASPAQYQATDVEVVNESTLAGLQRQALLSTEPVGVLNFASAKNPGGGFLNGSQAQEESLARSSALYASLLKVFAFYERHRAQASCLYSDEMIFSPDCPVIRNDDGDLLSQPLLASFITSPAPNAGATADNRPHESHLIPDVLQRRSELVLALAAAQGLSTLILGAWGCGVFRNDPVLVAQAFATHLSGTWSGRFRKIIFSVLDRSESKDTLTAFQTAFAQRG